MPGQAYSGTSRPVDMTVEASVSTVAMIGSSRNIVGYGGLNVRKSTNEYSPQGSQ